MLLLYYTKYILKNPIKKLDTKILYYIIIEVALIASFYLDNVTLGLLSPNRLDKFWYLMPANRARVQARLRTRIC